MFKIDILLVIVLRVEIPIFNGKGIGWSHENIVHFGFQLGQHGGNSTSVRVCNLIKKIIGAKDPDIEVETLQLMKEKINFCLLCGDCYEDSECPYD